MTPVFQKFYARYPGERPGPGVWGDCSSASLASVLDLPLAAVPHFAEVSKGDVSMFWWHVNRFLAARDLLLIQTMGTDFQGVRFAGAADCYHLILATDVDGDGHTLVGLNGKIVFDPAPSKPVLVTDPKQFIFGFLVRST